MKTITRRSFLSAIAALPFLPKVATAVAASEPAVAAAPNMQAGPVEIDSPVGFYSAGYFAISLMAGKYKISPIGLQGWSLKEIATALGIEMEK